MEWRCSVRNSGDEEFTERCRFRDHTLLELSGRAVAMTCGALATFLFNAALYKGSGNGAGSPPNWTQELHIGRKKSLKYSYVYWAQTLVQSPWVGVFLDLDPSVKCPLVSVPHGRRPGSEMESCKWLSGVQVSAQPGEYSAFLCLELTVRKSNCGAETQVSPLVVDVFLELLYHGQDRRIRYTLTFSRVSVCSVIFPSQTRPVASAHVIPAPTYISLHWIDAQDFRIPFPFTT